MEERLEVSHVAIHLPSLGPINGSLVIDLRSS
jgi:hypothetical protein